MAPAFSKDPDPDLDKAFILALTSNNWSWSHEDGGNKGVEEIQFYKGGIAECSKATLCSWKITSPQTVVLQNVNDGRDKGKIAQLVFNAEFTHFIGFDFNGKTVIEGYRKEWLDPNRPPPSPRDPGEK